MSKDGGTLFLFTIAKEIKRSFENPVIYLTQKDYAISIFNSLVDMRNVLLKNATPDVVLDIVNTFHLSWLQSIHDVESFKKRAKDTPRDIVTKNIDYTVECVKTRHTSFQRFVEQLQTNITSDARNAMQADVEIIGDLQDVVNYALIEKRRCLEYLADKADFDVIVLSEIEELMNWLDSLYDQLAIDFSKVLDLEVPLLPSDFVKILQKIIDDVGSCPSSDFQEASNDLTDEGRRSSSMVKIDAIRDLEIARVVEKIKNVEERINRSKLEDASAVMALEHKTLYLEERLQSLENLKISLKCLKIQRHAIHDDKTKDEEELHIFSHLLPHRERCRLVERLVQLWKSALNGDLRRKSIISILSAADMKEVFSDVIGNFTVDKYGRKIYTKEGDSKNYQLNERNELVPVKDDEKHVYFYDECGRYYLNETRERVYKAHASASEYLLHRAGFMLKMSDNEDGVEYKYDNLGRYHLNDEGVRIYKDKESNDEYQHDGLGNLVRIRESAPVYSVVCPVEPMVTEDSKYLKRTVGAALRKCIATVVLVLPTDPIKYLADCLVNYRQNIDKKQFRESERQVIMAAREHTVDEHSSDSLHTVYDTVIEESVTDSNFRAYEPLSLEL